MPLNCFCSPLAGLVLSGCGYNTIQVQDEQVKSAWSEVVNQYQRRADLIPNLVNTVKGFAAQEQAVLIGVTEARAKATQTQVAVDPTNPASLQQFQAAQGELSSALVAPDGRRRALPGIEVGPELPRPAGATRGHGEPHHRGAQSLYPVGAGLQRDDPEIPDEPDRDGVRLRREAELHGRERSADRAAADGRFRHADGTPAPTPAPTPTPAPAPATN